MHKALGVILLLSACVYYIYTQVLERKEKLKNLSEIKKAVIYLKNELSFSAPEIISLCEQAADKTCGEVSRMFSDVAQYLRQDKNTDFCTGWKRAQNGRTLFSDRTEEIFWGLFDEFGKKSLEIEISNLERAQCLLEETEKSEEKKYAEERKLICTLGAAFCAFVIIIAI